MPIWDHLGPPVNNFKYLYKIFALTPVFVSPKAAHFCFMHSMHSYTQKKRGAKTAPQRHRFCLQNRPLCGTILALLFSRWSHSSASEVPFLIFFREKWLLFAKRSRFPKWLPWAPLLAPLFSECSILNASVGGKRYGLVLSIKIPPSWS